MFEVEYIGAIVDECGEVVLYTRTMKHYEIEMWLREHPEHRVTYVPIYND